MMKLLKILLGLALFGVAAGACVAALAVWYFGRDLPDYQALVHYKPPVVTRVYAADGRLMTQYATEDRIFVPVSAMPPLVIHAFLAAEDRYFFTNPGINPLSIVRAAAIDVVRLAEHERPIGASTITQQVAKNFLLNNNVSLVRKIKEALVAIRMDQAMSKERILELYINEIYLGDGSYGVAAAALNYFNKSLDQLDVQQAAFLAALPKAPDNYNPVSHPRAARDRRNWVIDRMADAGFITPQQASEAKAQPIVLRRRDPTQIARAPYFASEVRRELLERYGRTKVYEGGLAVRTSLDPRLEADANRALRDALEAYDRRHGWRGPVAHVSLEGDWQSRLAVIPLPAGAEDIHWRLAVVLATPPDAAIIGFPDGRHAEIPYRELRWARREINADELGPVPATSAAAVSAGDVVLVERLGGSGKVYGLRQIPEVSGALVALDPHTGRVLAMSGGFSYAMSQFDRA
ncbi:MAG TPA: transglycosylase domain-containing protein, partial [Stellaceae bacterium]|nr:transglycosylase domain-containing protein [Stellaceae bacterium]